MGKIPGFCGCLLAALVAAGCGGDDEPRDGAPGSGGGTSATGGSSATAGSGGTASGGAATTGGATSSGGTATSSGGAASADPCAGYVTVKTAADLARVATCTSIPGTLSIDLDTGVPGEVTFPVLASAGNVAISNGDALVSLEFPVLTAITSNLGLGQGPRKASLETLSFPALASIGTGFSVANTPSLTTFTLPELKSIGGQLRLSYVGLTEWSLPKLVTAGSFTINTMTDLKTLSFPSLESTTDGLSITDDGLLTTFRAAKLTTVGESLWFETNNALTTLSLPSLTSVKSAFYFVDNPRLPTCEIEKLRAQLTSAPEGEDVRRNDDITSCP